jgi:hypothetical protein
VGPDVLSSDPLPTAPALIRSGPGRPVRVGMRRSYVLVALAVTTLVALAFCIPLGLLVVTAAQDRRPSASPPSWSWPTTGTWSSARS